MHIAIGADHAGFKLKQVLRDHVTAAGYGICDLGTYDSEPADYPDSAEAVALAILNNQADRGILLCGSGIGASIAANKLPGIRAGLCHDTYTAAQGVEHDDMNILVLGGRLLDNASAMAMADAFLNATFSGAERHQSRLAKLDQIEQRYLRELNQKG